MPEDLTVPAAGSDEFSRLARGFAATTPARLRAELDRTLPDRLDLRSSAGRARRRGRLTGPAGSAAS